jgi:hypothetical protein
LRLAYLYRCRWGQKTRCSFTFSFLFPVQFNRINENTHRPAMPGVHASGATVGISVQSSGAVRFAFRAVAGRVSF